MILFKRPNDEVARFLITVCRGGTIVFGGFALIVSIIMIASYIQLESSDPLNDPLIEAALESYRSNSDDEAIKSQIRALDLVARRAFFVRRRQLEIGTYLLLIGAGLAVIFARLDMLLRRGIPQSGYSDIVSPKGRIAVGVAGALLLVSAVGSSLLAGKLSFPDSQSGTAVADTAEEMFPEGYDRMWPGFRGPYGNGRSFGDAPPFTWNVESGENVLWQKPVPLPGFGSPVVWDGNLFLSGADRSDQAVFCWDVETGDLLWQTTVGPYPGSPASPPRVTVDTGYAAATVATDGRTVFAIFATGDIGAVDRSGTPVWGRNMGVPDNLYGHSSSLMTYGGDVIVQFDHMESAALMILNGRTGGTVWSADRAPMTNWSSPVIIRGEEIDQILVNGNPSFISYSGKTGDELYRYDDIFGEVASSPAYGSTATGQVRVVIINQLLSIICLDAETGDPVWEVYDDLPDATSPLVADGYVFIATSYGVLTCIDLEDGTILWKEEFSDGFYASPIAVAGHILTVDRQGICRIIEISDSYTLVSESAFGGPVVTTPAISGSRLFVRTDSELLAIGRQND